MIENIIITLVAGFAGALFKVLADRYSKSKAERDLGMASDYLKLADMTGAQLEKKINQINVLESKIEAIQEARKKREIEIQSEHDELKVRIQSDLMETRELRADYASAQKRIIKLEDMVIKLSEYADTMKNAMQKAEIPVPLNGELMESVYKLKLQREEIKRLRGDK